MRTGPPAKRLHPILQPCLAANLGCRDMILPRPSLLLLIRRCNVIHHIWICISMTCSGCSRCPHILILRATILLPQNRCCLVLFLYPVFPLLPQTPSHSHLLSNMLPHQMHFMGDIATNSNMRTDCGLNKSYFRTGVSIVLFSRGVFVVCRQRGHRGATTIVSAVIVLQKKY